LVRLCSGDTQSTYQSTAMQSAVLAQSRWQSARVWDDPYCAPDSRVMPSRFSSHALCALITTHSTSDSEADSPEAINTADSPPPPWPATAGSFAEKDHSGERSAIVVARRQIALGVLRVVVVAADHCGEGEQRAQPKMDQSQI
jgi:hypothetical protein